MLTFYHCTLHSSSYLLYVGLTFFVVNLASFYSYLALVTGLGVGADYVSV